MANEKNFETNLQQLTGRFTRYMVSRVIDNPLNQLLELEVPTTIPENFTVEFNFYSIVDNSLVSSIVLDSNDDDVFSVTQLDYVDESNRKLLFIDFSNSEIPLEQGRYQLVVNFFTPEIGIYNEPPLVVTDISPSRREIELRLAPQYITTSSLNQVVNFASPQISSDWVLDAVRQIFNQPPSATSNNIPTDTTNLTFRITETFLPTDIIALINNPNTNGQFTSSIKTATQTLLNRAYGYATTSINVSRSTTYIDAYGPPVFTNKNLNILVSRSISQALSTLTSTQTLGSYNLL